MQLPERIHFFSYGTGVSIELPLGFTPGDDGPDAASYVRYDDEDRVQAAVLVAALAAAPGGGDAAPLVQAMASVAGEVLDSTRQQIDDEIVDSAVLRFPQGLPAGGVVSADPDVAALLGSDLLVSFAAVGFGGRAVTITAAAPFEMAERYRPEFAEALASCRFIAEVPA